MPTKANFVGHHFVLLLVAAARATTMDDSGCEVEREELQGVKDKHTKYQKIVMFTMREIIDRQQNYDEEIKTKLAQMESTIKTLTSV